MNSPCGLQLVDFAGIFTLTLRLFSSQMFEYLPIDHTAFFAVAFLAALCPADSLYVELSSSFRCWVLLCSVFLIP